MTDKGLPPANDGEKISYGLLKDSHGIFEPAFLYDKVKKFLDVYDRHSCMLAYLPKYSADNAQRMQKLLRCTTGILYVKMLMQMHDHACSYDDIWTAVLKPRGMPRGNDIETFKSLRDNGYAALSHKGKYGRKFYKTTPMGDLVIESAKTNYPAFRVLRHASKSVEDFYTAAISRAMDPETMYDLTPESFVAMLDAIFTEGSPMQEHGSHFYWCNKLVSCLRGNQEFFETFDCPEVKTWLEAHASDASVQKFIALYGKAAKKHAKKQAA